MTANDDPVTTIDQLDDMLNDIVHPMPHKKTSSIANGHADDDDDDDDDKPKRLRRLKRRKDDSDEEEEKEKNDSRREQSIEREEESQSQQLAASTAVEVDEEPSHKEKHKKHKKKKKKKKTKEKHKHKRRHRERESVSESVADSDDDEEESLDLSSDSEDGVGYNDVNTKKKNDKNKKKNSMHVFQVDDEAGVGNGDDAAAADDTIGDDDDDGAEDEDDDGGESEDMEDDDANPVMLEEMATDSDGNVKRRVRRESRYLATPARSKEIREDFVALNDDDGTFCISFSPLDLARNRDGNPITTDNGCVTLIGTQFSCVKIAAEGELVAAMTYQPVGDAQETHKHSCRSVESTWFMWRKLAAFLGREPSPSEYEQKCRRARKAAKSADPSFEHLLVCIAVPADVAVALQCPTLVYRVRVSLTKTLLPGIDASEVACTQMCGALETAPVLSADELKRYGWWPVQRWKSVPHSCTASMPIVSNCAFMYNFEQWEPIPIGAHNSKLAAFSTKLYATAHEQLPSQEPLLIKGGNARSESPGDSADAVEALVQMSQPIDVMQDDMAFIAAALEAEKAEETPELEVFAAAAAAAAAPVEESPVIVDVVDHDEEAMRRFFREEARREADNAPAAAADAAVAAAAAAAAAPAPVSARVETEGDLQEIVGSGGDVEIADWKAVRSRALRGTASEYLYQPMCGFKLVHRAHRTPRQKMERWVGQTTVAQLRMWRIEIVRASPLALRYVNVGVAKMNDETLMMAVHRLNSSLPEKGASVYPPRFTIERSCIENMPRSLTFVRWAETRTLNQNDKRGARSLEEITSSLFCRPALAPDNNPIGFVVRKFGDIAAQTNRGAPVKVEFKMMPWSRVPSYVANHLMFAYGSIFNSRFWSVAMHTTPELALLLYSYDAISSRPEAIAAAATLLHSDAPQDLLFANAIGQLPANFFRLRITSNAEEQEAPHAARIHHIEPDRIIERLSQSDVTLYLDNIARLSHARLSGASGYAFAWPQPDINSIAFSLVRGAIYSHMLANERQSRADPDSVVVSEWMPPDDQLELFLASKHLTARRIGGGGGGEDDGGGEPARVAFMHPAALDVVQRYEALLDPVRGPFVERGVDVVRVETRAQHDAVLERCIRAAVRDGCDIVVLCVDLVAEREFSNFAHAHLSDLSAHIITGSTDGDHHRDGSTVTVLLQKNAGSFSQLSKARLPRRRARLCVPFAHLYRNETLLPVLRALTAMCYYSMLDKTATEYEGAARGILEGDPYWRAARGAELLETRLQTEAVCGSQLTLIGLPLYARTPLDVDFDAASDVRNRGGSPIDDLYFAVPIENTRPVEQYGDEDGLREVAFLRAYSGAGALLGSFEYVEGGESSQLYRTTDRCNPARSTTLEFTSNGIETVTDLCEYMSDHRLAGMRHGEVWCSERLSVASYETHATMEGSPFGNGGTYAASPSDLLATRLVRAQELQGSHASKAVLFVADALPSNPLMIGTVSTLLPSPALLACEKVRSALHDERSAYADPQMAARVCSELVPVCDGSHPQVGTMFDALADRDTFEAVAAQNGAADPSATLRLVLDNKKRQRQLHAGMSLGQLLGLFFHTPRAIAWLGNFNEAVAQRLRARFSVFAHVETPRERSGGGGGGGAIVRNWFESYGACAQSAVPYTIGALTKNAKCTRQI